MYLVMNMFAYLIVVEMRDGRLVDVEVAAEVGRGVGEHVGIGYGGS